MFNNESLLHWCVGTILGWTVWGLLLGLAVHLLWGTPFLVIGKFVGLQCALQVAVTPWLFAARASKENPLGQPFRRATIVTVWFTLAGLLACLAIFTRADYANRTAVTIFFGTPVVLGAISLLVLRWLIKRKLPALS